MSASLRKWQEIRVFISSTFRDMHAERDHLIKVVFPELRERLEKHRFHLVDIDLRWGVTVEQAENDRVLDLCLDEINRCRPFFVGILGQRYGWVPDEFPDPAVKKYGWIQGMTGKSITELEILHGVLRNPAITGHAMFYLREKTYLGDVPEDVRDSIYTDQYADKSAAVRREIGDFCRQHDAPCRPYPCTWDASRPDPENEINGRIVGLEQFGEWVKEDLWNAIAREHPQILEESSKPAKPGSDDWLAEEQDYHERFIESRLCVYVGRQRIQQKLVAFLESDTAQPMLLVGGSGTGKSAIMGKLWQEWERRHPDELVIFHFVGASGSSTNHHAMLRRFCLTLCDRFNITETIEQEGQGSTEQPKNVPDDPQKLLGALREFLEAVPDDQRIVLLIDAVNQLDELGGAQEMNWLPTNPPANIRVVVSCIEEPEREEPILNALRRRNVPEIQVEPLDDEDRRRIVAEIPSISAKSLDETQIALLLRNDATRNPLFLTVALEELRGFGSFDLLNERIQSLPSAEGEKGVVELFGQVIERLERDVDENVVKTVLSLVAVSRSGLSERELTQLLRRELNRDCRGDLQVLLRQTRPYLLRRGELVDFYHRSFYKAVTEHYLDTEARQRQPHQSLALFFEGLARGTDPHSPWEGSCVRGFSECVYHFLKAGQDDHSCSLLTTFPFLFNKLRNGLLEQILDDYTLARSLLLSDADRLSVWDHFFHGKAHVLRRGTNEWPTERILLQFAAEGGEESPVTEAAERWLKGGFCDWTWLRRASSYRRRDGAVHSLVLEGHVDYILDAIEVDGARLLSISEDHTLRLWDTLNGRCLKVLNGRAALGKRSPFTSDGKVLVCEGSTLHVWDIAVGVSETVLDGHTERITGVMETTGGLVASWSSGDCSLRLWSPDDGRCTAVLRLSNAPQSALEIADGRILISCRDGKLRLWDCESDACDAILQRYGERISMAMLRCGLPVNAISEVKVLSGGQIMALSKESPCIHLWRQLQSGPSVRLEGHSRAIQGTVELPGDRLLSWSGGSSLCIWDVEHGELAQVLEGHTDTVLGVLLLSDGSVLSWSKDGTLRIWSIASGKCLRVLRAEDGDINGVSELRGNRICASVGCTLVLWCKSTGRCLAKLQGHKGWISGQRELDGNRILSWSWDGTLRVWDTQRGDCQTVMKGHSGTVYDCIEIGDDRVASWADDNMVCVWHTGTGTALNTLTMHSVTSGLRMLTDGRLLSWSDDGTLQIWEQPTSASPEASCARYRHAIPLNSSRHVLSWGGSRLHVLDWDTGDQLAELRGHSRSIDSAIELRDGRILSWAEDHTLRLWDLRNECCVGVLEGHSKMILGVRQLRDGTILSYSCDNSIRLWNESDGACRRILTDNCGIDGVRELLDGTILSWNNFPGTLRLWNPTISMPPRVFRGHKKPITGWRRETIGAVELSTGEVLSWSSDKLLRIWNFDTSAHVDFDCSCDVWGALELSNGDILTWSRRDGVLRIWARGVSEFVRALYLKGDEADGRYNDATRVLGVRELPGSMLLAWYHIPWAPMQEAIRVWDLASGDCQIEDVAEFPADLRSDLLYRREQHEHPSCVASDAFAMSHQRAVLLKNRSRAATDVAWHSSSLTHAFHLASDGTVIAKQRDGELYLLKLFRGNIRVDLNSVPLDRKVR